MVVALLVSAGLHAFIIFGIGPTRHKPAPKVEEEKLIAFTVAQLKPEDLDEPEPAPRDEADSNPVISAPVPMQADVLRLPQPNDFIQQVDMQSLLPQPDLSQVKVFVIPEHINRGARVGAGIGAIFNLADLDRVPEPVVQPTPLYPPTLKREGLTATVRVEFIVDIRGQVLDPFVVDSTHHGFDEAAVAGVLRWKFKPGVRMGRRVNTRMQVPIIFKVVDGMN
jgi:periplasmic protein TonB